MAHNRAVNIAWVGCGPGPGGLIISARGKGPQAGAEDMETLAELARERKAQEAYDRMLARRTRAMVKRSTLPWASVGKVRDIVTAEGTVAYVGDGVSDLLAVDPEPRKVEGFMHRASVRIRPQGSDEFGPVNAPRRNGDGFMEYKVHERVRMVNGYKAVGIRSDAWAKARKPEVGYARLARLMMDRADVIGDRAPARGLGNGTAENRRPVCSDCVSSVTAEPRLLGAQSGFKRQPWPTDYRESAPIPRECTCDQGSLWALVRTTYNGRSYRYESNRETGEVRGFGLLH